MTKPIVNNLFRAYCYFVALWFLSNQFFQDSWSGQVALDKFAEYFLFASIPIFLLSLINRKQALIIYAAIPMLVCAYFYLPFFLKFPTPPEPSAGGNLRVATYNIWNHNKDIDAVVQLINSSNPDLIAIQEITEEQRPYLVERLSLTYPFYHISEPVYGGTTGLFSRLELANVQELNFGIDRPAILADFNWRGKVMSIASAHLNPSFWAYYQQAWQDIPGNYLQYIKDQKTQASMIVEALMARTGSIARYIACDCNSQETASTNRLLRASFNDTFRSLGWQMSNPDQSGVPFERNLSHIDYVWHEGDVKPIAIYRARDSAGSDHEPVFADFRVAH